MKKFIRIYSDVLSYIGILGLVGFIITVLVQVFSRTFLPKTPNWTEEASRFLFIYMVSFAGNTAVVKDEYVGVDMLTGFLQKKIQKAIRVLVLLCILAFSFAVFYFCVVGADGLLAMTPETMVSTALTLPMKYVYISTAILFGLYCISYIMRIYCVIADIQIYEHEEGAL